jgi:oligopeptide transport system substrate-binding protein
MKFWPAALFLTLSFSAADAATVLNRGNGGEPESLDPQFASGTLEANIVGDLMTGLTTLDAAAKPIPGAAERWDVSQDGLTWTFHLRDETWSDGVKLTAGDFVFAWRRLLDPKTAARSSAILWVVKNARGISAGKLPPAALAVRAPDTRTLVVQLEHPAPYLPELLTNNSAQPLPEHVVAAKGAGWARPGSYVGNGAYLLKDWVPGDHITLIRNPRFYDAAHVRIDSVTYYPTADSAAALKRYRAGELDMINPVPVQQIDWLRANLKSELKVTPSLALSYIAINLDDPALKDVRVRRALNLAYNREAVTQKVVKLGEPPAYGIVPPGIANYHGAEMDFRALPYPARVAQAQSLMQAAGYGPGHPLRLTYSAFSNPDSRRLAALFQALCRPLYVDIDIQITDLPVLMRNLRQHQFQLSSASWFADYNDASNFLDLLRGGAAGNYADYRNARFDATMDQAQNEPDADKRGALLAAAEKIALADYPWIPVRFAVQTDLVKPSVKGWVANVRDYQRSRWLWLQK